VDYNSASDGKMVREKELNRGAKEGLKMKLIIDIDQDTLKNIQEYCEVQNTTPGILLENLFNQYLQEPKNIIDEIIRIEGNLDEFHKFNKFLVEYLNEAIYDIEESAKSDQAYETDEAMARVFKALARDHIDQAHILTNLYKVYKEK